MIRSRACIKRVTLQSRGLIATRYASVLAKGPEVASNLAMTNSHFHGENPIEIQITLDGNGMFNANDLMFQNPGQFSRLQSILKKSDKITNEETNDNANENQDQPKDESNIIEETPETDKDTTINKKIENDVSSASGSDSAVVTSGGAAAGSGGNGDDGDDKTSPIEPIIEEKKEKSKPKEPKTLEDETSYPPLLTIPILSRPLFPGFYKPINISDVQVMNAVKQSLDKKVPYVAIFLLKDGVEDSDVIHNKEDVHEVGVLAQITGTYPAFDEVNKKNTLCLLVYPHKRIRLESIRAPKATAVVEGAEATEVTEAVTEAVVSDVVEDENDPTYFLKDFNVSLAEVSDVPDAEFDPHSPKINALTTELLDILKQISGVNKSFKDSLSQYSKSLNGSKNIYDDPTSLSDLAGAFSHAKTSALQKLLEANSMEEKLTDALILLKNELSTSELKDKISRDVDTRVSKKQREYYLMEHLKGIKKELGLDDGKEKLVEEFKRKAEKLTMPEAIETVFNDEINRLSTLEPSSSEYSVVRTYLEWITSLPWGKYSQDEFNINAASEILNEDHYGLKDVKERILEFIAVGKLLGKVDGKIICFVGPPGVGKTSIGKSIAKSLNREFFRFSVGGLSDVAEIKGHRRTYIGSLPGRIVHALKKTQTSNPLILIDEIDKISLRGSHQGDPSSALLEVLDPEQNNTFLDQYMDVPIDLSKVLFICTANSLSTIPAPLLDRMEIIEVAGYVEDEKVKIAQNYLAPEAKKLSGLEDVDVTMREDTLRALIRNYCRESGVRNLKKHISKVYRKAAFNIIKDLGEDGQEIVMEKVASGKSAAEEPIEKKKAKTISKKSKKDESREAVVETSQEESASESVQAEEKTNSESTESGEAAEPIEIPKFKVPDSVKIEILPEDLKSYVGPAIFTKDRLYETTPPGVVMGLAWTSMGGAALYIESVLGQPLRYDSTPRLEVTGQLGDVMKESSSIAYSCSKMFLGQNYPDNRFFEKAKIHLHCPEGATPKDGPSAGVTMTSSLLSLALKRSLDPTIAMTGELTLTGKVLKIGGLKEKTIAAKRSGCKTIIFPKDNEADWEEIPEYIREGLDFVAADWYSEIFEKIFPGITPEEINSAWKPDFDKIEAERKRIRDEEKA